MIPYTDWKLISSIPSLPDVHKLNTDSAFPSGASLEAHSYGEACDSCSGSTSKLRVSMIIVAVEIDILLIRSNLYKQVEVRLIYIDIICQDQQVPNRQQGDQLGRQIDWLR
ncbi:hypothetical protein FRX31_032835 [Thalictrum thalictroides]|uniref:Uncharacterized protein n=1 Tax=Thalictrum thalictroides TaxID=46969 RepID=A0A7J6UYU0_THATH|nr:hypothetical protein FRX31_032835 [Thalictrum thalictroides]